MEVTCPSNIKIPLLPAKINNKTIFPTGTWTGTYFIPELVKCKELVPGYSYKFPGEGGNVSIFEGKHIFNDYIDAFYRIKAEASKDSPQRWMAKMHLNSLYGIFGRSCEMNESSIIRKDDIQKVFLTFCVKSMIEITKDYYLITYKTNVNPEIVKDLKVEFKNLSLDDGFESKKVFNNVAIASAVTAYARMHMMQFKVGEIGDSLCYTDTDSIFTSKELPASMLGTELGLMKDELDGDLINQAYFLGIKRYLLDLGSTTKSVWAGVPKNTLSLDDFKSLLSGSKLVREYDNTFFKSMMDMTITIKSRSITLEINHDKSIVDGKYVPLNVNISSEVKKTKMISKKVNYFTKILNKIHKIINKPHRVCVIYKKVSKIKGRNLTFFELVETVDYGLKIWDP